MSFAARHMLIDVPRRSHHVVFTVQDFIRAPRVENSRLARQWVDEGKLCGKECVDMYVVFVKAQLPPHDLLFQKLAQVICATDLAGIPLPTCAEMLASLAAQRAPPDSHLIPHVTAAALDHQHTVDAPTWAAIVHSLATLQAALPPAHSQALASALERSLIEPHDCAETHLVQALQGTLHLLPHATPTLLALLRTWAAAAATTRTINQVVSCLAHMNTTDHDCVSLLVPQVIDQPPLPPVVTGVAGALKLLHNHPQPKLAKKLLTKLLHPKVVPAIGHSDLATIIHEAYHLMGVSCRTQVQSVLRAVGKGLPPPCSARDHEAAAVILNIAMRMGVSSEELVEQLAKQIDAAMLTEDGAVKALTPLVVAHRPRDALVLQLLQKVKSVNEESAEVRRAKKTAVTWYLNKSSQDVQHAGGEASAAVKPFSRHMVKPHIKPRTAASKIDLFIRQRKEQREGQREGQ
eukprot:TRINITY_DN7980_c0_g1_i2.p1 TRINITY_DN7980_c0_g1~~TRINITY_DN7980_c0_g1_i2.p1  ORF type:complete len:462 (+),score=90.00 TRINITY_DN7980_c0_g1_i2:79-1464(+)